MPNNRKPPAKRPSLLTVTEIQTAVFFVALVFQMAAFLVMLDIRKTISRVAPFPEYNARRLDVVVAKVDSLDGRFRVVEAKLQDVAKAWDKD